ncbi:Phosphoribosyl pyrophosphate synthase-associated protein 2 [Toxocara canis]|uniref:Phosphoribosyl pyrophosphate synthase-associated protein 2 n=1 Tax=Toxocara canis TaxID=6265 RepID=A0A0B2VNW5_TOXCA|nr:Phosphoribosyl pyrophosphate synthase-associated protein 2 [Toxocara canis]
MSNDITSDESSGMVVLAGNSHPKLAMHFSPYGSQLNSHAVHEFMKVEVMSNDITSDESSGMVVLAGNSHPKLAMLVSERLGIRLGDAIVYNKPNRETAVDIKQSVRGKHVFILQSASKDVNNNIMELLILMHTCKTSSAKTITVILPYLPYSKQCRMLRRSAIPMKLIADMICKTGATRLVSLDLYRKEIQGFFSIPVDNLRASPFLLAYIRENIPDYKNAVVVAKSPGVMNKATSYADRLRLGVAVIHGEPKDGESMIEDGRQSPPLRSHLPEDRRGSLGTLMAPYELFPQQAAKEKPPLTVVGDVGGRIAIIVDDIIDEAQSFVAAAEVLKARGAYKIYVIATHGLLSADAPALLEESSIDQVVVTNSVPHEMQKLRCHKICTVDISLMISEAIRRIYYGESMGQLFRDVTLDD